MSSFCAPKSVRAAPTLKKKTSVIGKVSLKTREEVTRVMRTYISQDRTTMQSNPWRATMKPLNEDPSPNRRTSRILSVLYLLVQSRGAGAKALKL